jgi:dihydrolipoamide dehydrogenase
VVNQMEFDLVVIGAGPGGYVAAIRAAQLGMKVACIDKAAWGGTCLNIGCIPSKALLDSSELYYETRHSFKRHGIQVDNPQIDVSAMMERKNKIIKTMTTGVAGLFRKNKVEAIQGLARIKDPNTVEVHHQHSNRVITTSRILLATGSAPIQLPNLPFDRKHIISSEEALSLSQVPEKMVVIGAGAIGLELGSVWSRLGAEVSVIELQDTILPGMDREMANQLQKLLQRQGLKITTKASAQSTEIRSDKVHITIKTETGELEETCDLVLVAVGRRPCIEHLRIENLHIKTTKRGFIEVNERFETSVPGIFAIGDVIPGPMLAHKAEEEGVACVEIMAGKHGHVNYNTIPAVVYTHPELASVGLTEEQVLDKKLEVRIGRFPFRANGRAHCLDAPDGLVKIISDAKTDRMLAMHILGPRASDIITEAVIAMEFHASSEDIARSVHAHPTLPEAIREAALAVDNRAIHI